MVIPAYRSSGTLPDLVHRLAETFDGLGRSYEVIVIDDCSPDDTWETLRKLQAARSELRIARLLRNSGQHNAILCGLSQARGEVVVTMDDDLQNPPEEIPSLLAALDQGFDLAIGAYGEKQHDRARNLGGSLIDGLQRRIFGLPADFQLTSFRAVRRSVVDQVVNMGGVYPYITSMLLSHAGRYVNVPVRHDERTIGQSNYTLHRSFSLAMNLVLSYSSYPLYFVVVLCAVALGCSIALGGWVLWGALLAGTGVPGWASTLVAISFFNGLILLAIVILGLYVSRMNRQVTRSRVPFAIAEMHE